MRNPETSLLSKIASGFFRLGLGFTVAGCGTGAVNTLPTTDYGPEEDPHSLADNTATNPFEFYMKDFEDGVIEQRTPGFTLTRNEHFIDEPVTSIILQPYTEDGSELPITLSMECEARRQNLDTYCEIIARKNNNGSLGSKGSLEFETDVYNGRINGTLQQGLEGTFSQIKAAGTGAEAYTTVFHGIIHSGNSPGFVPPNQGTDNPAPGTNPDDDGANHLEEIANYACSSLPRPQGTDIAVYTARGSNSDGIVGLTSNTELVPDYSDPTAEGNAIHHRLTQDNTYVISVAGEGLGTITTMYSSLGGFNPEEQECRHIHVLGKGVANNVYTTTAEGESLEVSEVYRQNN